ncbi:DNA-binding MarR family transcriptional regulator [Streptomyces achromogenes]|uniref:DNA-binding MarR family transcriptional regulator n=1 Tax=Streptomyces achromogenes TaxID=67255 RepID=A0ABU0QCV2_STRAH|nr:MarR family winged helix-turn-helix transcriptional regulator [Streptomyces achromogenes]MDQ0688467.1 DNA-binding MarR family transcriptional regulator [Streptomyces achromogenes]
MPLRPEDSPGLLLWHATLRWQRDIATALAPLELTHVQFVLLACTWWLNSQGEHPNQMALARQAGTDVKMTSQVLRALEHKGLIERETDPADTRAKRLRVTDTGAETGPPRDRGRRARRRAVLRAGARRRRGGSAPAAGPSAPRKRRRLTRGTPDASRTCAGGKSFAGPPPPRPLTT